jgi:hypothetical protein
MALARPAQVARRPPLWEFTLGRLNPESIDYGAELEQKRQIFLRQLGGARLWLKASGLGLMLSGWALAVRQRAEKRRREIIAAELLAQYHNALTEARVRLEQAIADNAALREAAQSVGSSTLPDPLSGVNSVAPAAIYVESNFPARARSRTPATTAADPQTGPKLAELEQQLRESRQREKLLERELERIPPQRRSSPLAQGTIASPRSKAPPL